VECRNWWRWQQQAAHRHGSTTALGRVSWCWLVRWAITNSPARSGSLAVPRAGSGGVDRNGLKDGSQQAEDSAAWPVPPWFEVQLVKATCRPGRIARATDQRSGGAGFCRILRNQAKAISLQAQGHPIATLQPQKLPQPCRDHQLTLGRQRELLVPSCSRARWHQPSCAGRKAWSPSSAPSHPGSRTPHRWKCGGSGSSRRAGRERPVGWCWARAELSRGREYACTRLAGIVVVLGYLGWVKSLGIWMRRRPGGGWGSTAKPCWKPLSAVLLA
jgi:hypothetical protein